MHSDWRNTALTLDRRGFVGACASSLPLAVLAGLSRPLAWSEASRDVLYSTSDGATGLSLLRLPDGFRYTSFGWTADPMSDGRASPPQPDGMAVVAASGARLTLIRNHEVVTDDGAFGPPETAYDTAAGGGTTTLVFDAGAGRLLSSRASLSGTLMNCAGGPTPWGSWLSCEEAVADAGSFYDGWPLTRLSKDHGFVFEVPAEGAAQPRPLEAMGRFCHEAAAVDPDTGIVYLTEDLEPTSGFYRFVPAVPGALERGGRLQMMAVRGRRQMNRRIPDGPLAVDWVDIDAPQRGHYRGCDQAGVVRQGLAAGATGFVRLEGCWYERGRVYFSSTSGGDAGRGTIFCHDPQEQTVTKLFESPHQRDLDGPDNLTVAPNGAVIICEDGNRYGQLILALTPTGKLIPIARNNVELHGERNGIVGDFRNAEWCGACFSPDGQWLFANIQQPGISFAITGPWDSLLSGEA